MPAVTITFKKLIVGHELIEPKAWLGPQDSEALETIRGQLKEAFKEPKTKTFETLCKIERVTYPHLIQGTTEKDFFNLMNEFNEILKPLDLRIFGSEKREDRFGYDVAAIYRGRDLF